MPRMNEEQRTYMHERGYVTLPEAASLAFVAPSTVHRMVARGQLEAKHLPGVRYVSRKDLAALFEEPVKSNILKAKLADPAA